MQARPMSAIFFYSVHNPRTLLKNCTTNMKKYVLCVDMRQVNQVIIRESLPIPAVEKFSRTLTAAVCLADLPSNLLFIRES